MTEFLVQWAIDLDCDDPADAAEQALRIQRDPNSDATVFEVISPDGQVVEVDVAITGTRVLKTMTKEDV